MVSLLISLVLSFVPSLMLPLIPLAQDANGDLPPVIASSLAVGTALTGGVDLAEVYTVYQYEV